MSKFNRYWLRRELRANLRDTQILIRQFFWPLLAFIAALIIGGALYFRLALSATSMAVPAFAAAAAGVEMTRPITIDGRPHSLASITVKIGAPLTEMTVGEIETHYEVSIVLLRRQSESDYHPAGTIQIKSGDILGVLGGMSEISTLVQVNQGPS